MNAVRIHEHGPRDVLTYDELPVPDIRRDEVLIKIKTAALNHLDIWVRNGIPGVSLPLIMGSDAAGIVHETGKAVTSYKPGDEVVIAPLRSCGECQQCRMGRENMCAEFQIPGESAQGVQSEFVVVKEKYLFTKPQTLNWNEAAAFPLAGITAFHMLHQKVQLAEEEVVLIYGASSGVGSAAIQIAKAKGATVITTAASLEKEELASQLGADHVINYKSESIGRRIKEITNGRGVDVVFEHTGLSTWNESLRALQKGGRLVTCGATTGPIVKIDIRALFVKHQQLIGSTMGTLKDLSDLVTMIDAGSFKPVVGKVFDAQHIKEAHRWLEEGKQLGKVIVRF